MVVWWAKFAILISWSLISILLILINEIGKYFSYNNVYQHWKWTVLANFLHNGKRVRQEALSLILDWMLVNTTWVKSAKKGNKKENFLLKQIYEFYVTNLQLNKLHNKALKNQVSAMISLMTLQYWFIFRSNQEIYKFSSK